MKIVLVGTISAICFVAAAAKKYSVVLTKDNFEKKTKDKTVFLKFYTPGCDGCKELDVEWEKLAANWTGHDQALVGELDCARNRASKSWCKDDLRIDKFPVILYGDTVEGGNWLREYGRNRTFDIMFNFTNRTLPLPFCTPGNVEKNCDSIKSMEIMIMQKMSMDKIDKSISQYERVNGLHQDEFDRTVDYIKNIEEKVKTNQALRVARMKANLRMLQEVKAACLDPTWTNFSCPEKSDETEVDDSTQEKADASEAEDSTPEKADDNETTADLEIDDTTAEL
jgi:thiol-disulfide isomerase/thioredoxin